MNLIKCFNSQFYGGVCGLPQSKRTATLFVCLALADSGDRTLSACIF